MISLRLAACTVLLPVALRAQLVCPAGEPASYFGWKSTECGNCSIYGTYIEYLTPPKIRDIDPDGPARGRRRGSIPIGSASGLRSRRGRIKNERLQDSRMLRILGIWFWDHRSGLPKGRPEAVSQERIA